MLPILRPPRLSPPFGHGEQRLQGRRVAGPTRRRVQRRATFLTANGSNGQLCGRLFALKHCAVVCLKFRLSQFVRVLRRWRCQSAGGVAGGWGRQRHRPQMARAIWQGWLCCSATCIRKLVQADKTPFAFVAHVHVKNRTEPRQNSEPSEQQNSEQQNQQNAALQALEPMWHCWTCSRIDMEAG